MAETSTFRNIVLILSIQLPLLSGCAGMSHMQNEVALKDLAHQAYNCEPGVPERNKYARHFERGWVQAYYNISKGADCCPPSAPPEQYWSTKYQSADGQRKIAAWYKGYGCGVSAAQRDCRDQFATVPIGARCVRESATKCNPADRIDGSLGASEVSQPIVSQKAESKSRFGEFDESAPSLIQQSSFLNPTMDRLPELGTELAD